MEQINTVDSYLKKLSRYDIYDNIFYRGQLEKYESITSSISRDLGFIKNERLIYEEAIRMKSTEFCDLLLPVERLSKMQHYGVPTRLVDLTIDPLIALFFAVQNVDDKSHGNVYIFVQPGYPLNDKRVRLLSILAMSESLNTEIIKNLYLECYSEEITENEILELASKGVFINYSTELQRSNKRLFSQKGTFAICGNEIIDKKIKQSILPLEDIEPTMIVRVPFEYKETIKKELDEKYNINEITVYPEFPSVADYLRNKYKNIDFNLKDTYNIVEVEDVSHVAARRTSIVVTLNKAFRIEEVKKIATHIIEKYKSNNDVIWIYIAKNGDDYIMKNWIIRGQWISKLLNVKFRPLIIGEEDDLGYIWRYEKSYSTLSDYYNKNVLQDDKILFIKNMKTFEKFEPYYKYMINIFEQGEMKSLEEYALKNENEIRNFFLKFGEFGISRNDKFNDYLSNFQEVSLHLENVVLWLKNQKINPRAKLYQVSSCFKEARVNFAAIKEQVIYWRKTINLTDDEYNKIDPEKILKNEYQYKQTIPLNPNAVNVTFTLDTLINSDTTVNIKGITNLFDEASLMISLIDSNGLLLAQNKSLVKHGKFDFGTLGKKGTGFDRGKYKIDISLSIPSTQNKEFIRKAGLEYENLKGKYIDRTGIGPSVSYIDEFEI